jgi:hypothetical protein
VQEKTAHEFEDRQCHNALAVPVPVIFPGKADPILLDRKYALVADGDAVRVAGQVLEHEVGTAKGRLGVDHPLERTRPSAQRTKRRRVPEFAKLTVKLKRPGSPGLFEKCEKFATEEPAEDPDGKEEARPAGNPA